MDELDYLRMQEISDLEMIIQKAKNWSLRHAEHAGQAPLSELDAILEGRDE